MRLSSTPVGTFCSQDYILILPDALMHLFILSLPEAIHQTGFLVIVESHLKTGIEVC